MNRWTKKEIVKLDKETIRKKYREFVKQVNDIDKDPDNQSVISRIDKLKDDLLLQGHETQRVMSGLGGSTSSLSSNGSGIRVTLV